MNSIMYHFLFQNDLHIVDSLEIPTDDPEVGLVSLDLLLFHLLSDN